MKGIIFNLLEEYVNDHSDGEAWEAVLEKCSLSTAEPLTIVAPGTYPDQDFFEIVLKTATFFEISEAELLNRFGRYALPIMARRYPHFFLPFQHPRNFLKFTGMVHQTEVKKLYKDAETPHFRYRELDNHRVALTYASKRHLGELVRGLLLGLGDYYRIPIKVELSKCDDQQEQPSCEFTLDFE